MTGKYLLAIDQGTTSTRAILYDENANPLAIEQLEHKQIYPKAGWVEHDPIELWQNTVKILSTLIKDYQLSPENLLTIGITNQRESTFLWDKGTAKPVYNAIVWQDTRTKDQIDRLVSQGLANSFRELTGLPANSYFSASKISWVLQSVPETQKLIEENRLAFGTSDSWLLWNLSGGSHNGVHATDVSNASRTLLMNLKTLDWAPEQLDLFKVPRSILPKILPSVGKFATVSVPNDSELSAINSVPITGILGDQQAAAFGQTAFSPGDAKNTYGTGNFLLVNTGEELLRSSAGLITTVAYQIEGEKPSYALEGSVAVTGSLVQWLRDNLGLISSSTEIETLAESVSDNGGVYFVPAFSGLYAPHWRSDARGTIVGLTGFSNRGHLARAVLEATAFQTKDVVQAINEDLATPLTELRVDGGMVANELLMQFQSDILDLPVIKPKIVETTALGAVYAAGLGIGHWKDLETLKQNWSEDKRWLPKMDQKDRSLHYWQWQKAIDKSLGWVEREG